ncbi:hypothetical protein [Phormidium tenue]|uniref:Uncharacterized protein n=1 Tax=Phormidium tenue NIES-30 TaxID=549789 RepID=A0A1U7J242_9CYAN|nr:hypothetical protein [Phormidium tenue]MBD2233715.1 hypothetical protein [Phormidium tenue FACHB-1052]OKH46134.1 hypothetical protein NIES30_17710 [Phormidium tenue NIES-30]
MADPSYPPKGIDPEMVKTVNWLADIITGRAPLPVIMDAAAAQASSDTPASQVKEPAPETTIPDPWEDG